MAGRNGGEENPFPIDGLHANGQRRSRAGRLHFRFREKRHGEMTNRAVVAMVRRPGALRVTVAVMVYVDRLHHIRQSKYCQKQPCDEDFAFRDLSQILHSFKKECGKDKSNGRVKKHLHAGICDIFYLFTNKDSKNQGFKRLRPQVIQRNSISKKE
jgi:hypothetical protein